jgi:hypothetical protein
VVGAPFVDGDRRIGASAHRRIGASALVSVVI